MESLYDKVMMDHIRNARNYRRLTTPSSFAEGVNPLCGDRFSIFLKISQTVIVDLSFQCECCGISMASASMMTELIKGQTETQARLVIDEFKKFLGQSGATFKHGTDINSIFGTMEKFPSRVNCASLGWTTLESALNGKTKVTLEI